MGQKGRNDMTYQCLGMAKVEIWLLGVRAAQPPHTAIADTVGAISAGRHGATHGHPHCALEFPLSSTNIPRMEEIQPRREVPQHVQGSVFDQGIVNGSNNSMC